MFMTRIYVYDTCFYNISSAIDNKSVKHITKSYLELFEYQEFYRVPTI